MTSSNKNTLNHNYLVLTRPVLTVMLLVMVAIMVVVVMLATTKTANAQTCYNNSADLEVVTCPATGVAPGCWVVPPSGPHGTGSPFEIDCPSATTSEGATSLSEYRQDELSLQNDNAEQIVKDNPIYALLLTFVNFFSAGVGLIVVTLVAVGGVEYMTAGGNPQKTQVAITRITNALIGLVLYLFMFAALQWLIPGGVFDSSANNDATTQVDQRTAQ